MILSQQLTSTAYTDEQKNTIITAITNEILVQLGYKPVETKLISTTEVGRDNQQVSGFYSTQTSSAYVNDPYNNNNYQLLQTSATEAQRAMDAQNGSDFQQDKAYRDERSLYSQNFGSYVADYTDFALGQSDQGSLSTQTNQASIPTYITSIPSVLNNEVANNNNIEFAGLDKELGDNKIKFNLNMNPAYTKQIFGALEEISGNNLLVDSQGYITYQTQDSTSRPVGFQLIQRLINSPYTLTIDGINTGKSMTNTDPSNMINASNGIGSNVNIFIDFSQTNGTLEEMLQHEGIHALRMMQGVWITLDNTIKEGNNRIPLEEFFTVGLPVNGKSVNKPSDITENKLLQEQGSELRRSYY